MIPHWHKEDLLKERWAAERDAARVEIDQTSFEVGRAINRFAARLIETSTACAERFAIYGAADYRNGKPRPACPLHAAGWDRARRDEAQRLLDAEYDAWVAAGCPEEGMAA